MRKSMLLWKKLVCREWWMNVIEQAIEKRGIQVPKDRQQKILLWAATDNKWGSIQGTCLGDSQYITHSFSTLGKT